MTVTVNVLIGTHEVSMENEGETLLPSFTWHERVPIYDWTLGKLEDWAAKSEDEEDYIRAEQNFIDCYAPGKAKMKGP